MEIDWLTVAAQAVNFLVLVYLLKRFLYRPVMDAMDRRQQRIAATEAEARRRQGEAEEATRAYRERREALEREREAYLAAMRQEAATERERLLEAARSEVEARRTSWLEDVAREREDFLRALRHQMAVSVTAIARRALGDLAGASLEEQTIRAFLDRLENVDADRRRALAEPGEALRVLTAFEPDPALRRRLEAALSEQLGPGLELVYEQVPALVCGIELRGGGHRVGWTLSGHLEALSAELEDALVPASGDAPRD